MLSGIDRDFRNIGEFVAFSIKERCRFKLDYENNNYFGFPYPILLKFQEDAWELSPTYDCLSSPRIYINCDGDFVRISIGDAFRGIFKDLVFNGKEKRKWEEVLFEGYIADPKFDLDKIIWVINCKFARFWFFNKASALLLVPFFGCVAFAFYFGLTSDHVGCLGASLCGGVFFVVLLVCLKMRILR